TSFPPLDVDEGHSQCAPGGGQSLKAWTMPTASARECPVEHRLLVVEHGFVGVPCQIRVQKATVCVVLAFWGHAVNSTNARGVTAKVAHFALVGAQLRQRRPHFGGMVPRDDGRCPEVRSTEPMPGHLDLARALAGCV